MDRSGDLSGTQTPREPAPAGRRSAEHWVVLTFAGVALVGLSVLGFALEPDPTGARTHEQLGLQPCMALERFGFPCPGCGVTTSVTLATQGRWLDSLATQPFGFLVALALGAFVVWAAIGHVARRDLFNDLQRVRLGRLSLAVGAFAAASWVYKIWRVCG